MEYFDIVDENGQPTGQIVERTEAHRTGAPHRTAHVWVIREGADGTEILMQKRSDDKDSFPGRYDTSSAGHIKAGDEPKDSALRELAEELGIEAQPEDLKYIGFFKNKYEVEFYGKLFKDDEYANVFVYEKPVEAGKLHIQKEELSEVRWFGLEYVFEEKLRHNRDFCVPIEGLLTLKHYLETEKNRSDVE